MKIFLGLSVALLIFFSGMIMGRYLLPARSEKSVRPEAETRSRDEGSSDARRPLIISQVPDAASHGSRVGREGPREKRGPFGPSVLVASDLLQKELDAMSRFQKDDIQEPSNNSVVHEISEEQLREEHRSSLRDDGVSATHEIERVVGSLFFAKPVPADITSLEH